ncbi:MAG: hypothetical protein Q8Q92_04950 [bacterium]|nr:hypothetical protein [bacterium]
MDSNTKKVLTVLAVLIVVVFGFFYAQNTRVYEFAGNVDKIESGIIFASGRFLKNGEPVPGQEDNPVNLQIKTDNKTKITRLALYIPKGVSSFNTKDLKQTESAASLDTIQNDFTQSRSMGIESSLRKGFLDKDYTAESLYFRVPIFNN